MNGKAVIIINTFLSNLQTAAGLTDAQFKNVRKNVKKAVSASALSPLEACMAVDMNDLIMKSKWN